jgi:hypothetical protein
METIYCYLTKKWAQRSRHSPEKLGDALKGFYDKYTNKQLTKMKFEYCPFRLSDPEDYKHWQYINNVSSFGYPPPETDDEIENNLKYIKKLNIISEIHKQKNVENNVPSEQHIYEIGISSYNDILKLIITKNGGKAWTSLFLSLGVDIDFDFKGYDYSVYDELFPSKFRQGHNFLYVYISNGCENGNQMKEENINPILKFHLCLPKFHDEERDLLRQIQKDLKVKFGKNQFFYYFIQKNGKAGSKKTEVIL